MRSLAAPMRELDLLRGLAIILMVVNHAGYRLADNPSADNGLLGALIFIGSFAPVVFFFTTGVGVALGRRSANRWADVLSAVGKAALLLIADQLAFWATGRPWGLDFLGFIALSTVCVTVVATSRQPVRLSAMICVALVVLRYVIGPRFFPRFEDPGLLAWFVGTTAVPNVSYPAAPWLIYPLLGFMLAQSYVQQAHSAASVQRWAWRALVASAAFLLLAWLLSLRGVVFYRWGVVSSGFFVLSFGVVFAAAALAMLLKLAWPWTLRFLGLRGAASLAVVPIHMVLIDVLVHALPPHSLGLWSFIGAATVLVAASIGLAVLFGSAVERGIAAVASPLALGGLGSVLLACLVVAWWVPQWAAYSLATVAIGQLAVTGLLAVRNRKRAKGGSQAKVVFS